MLTRPGLSSSELLRPNITTPPSPSLSTPKLPHALKQTHKFMVHKTKKQKFKTTRLTPNHMYIHFDQTLIKIH